MSGNTVLALPVFTKHPSATIDVDFRLVSDNGDTITSCDAAVIAPSGVTSSGVDISGATAKLWLAGGTDEVDYDVLLGIHTTRGRVEIGHIILKVRA